LFGFPIPPTHRFFFILAFVRRNKWRVGEEWEGLQNLSEQSEKSNGWKKELGKIRPWPTGSAINLLVGRLFSILFPTTFLAQARPFLPHKSFSFSFVLGFVREERGKTKENQPPTNNAHPILCCWSSVVVFPCFSLSFPFSLPLFFSFSSVGKEWQRER